MSAIRPYFNVQANERRYQQTAMNGDLLAKVLIYLNGISNVTAQITTIIAKFRSGAEFTSAERDFLVNLAFNPLYPSSGSYGDVLQRLMYSGTLLEPAFNPAMDYDVIGNLPPALAALVGATNAQIQAAIAAGTTINGIKPIVGGSDAPNTITKLLVMHKFMPEDVVNPATDYDHLTYLDLTWCNKVTNADGSFTWLYGGYCPIHPLWGWCHPDTVRHTEFGCPA